jgi:peptidoglycan/LPS O-acetylase OafA/YrhL
MRFATARARRVYPAYLAALLFSTLVLGATVTALPIKVYYLSPMTLWYAAVNAAFYTTVKDLPEVFANNPYPHTVNGSLWSLPLEVLCYFALYCAGRAGFLTRNRCALFVALGLAASVAWRTSGLGGALPHVVPGS